MWDVRRSGTLHILDEYDTARPRAPPAAPKPAPVAMSSSSSAGVGGGQGEGWEVGLGGGQGGSLCVPGQRHANMGRNGGR